MDRQAQEYLDSLLNKLPSSLSSDEIAFLRARRSYLNPMQTQFYAEILGDVVPEIEDPTDNLIREELEKGVEVEDPEVPQVEITEKITLDNGALVSKEVIDVKPVKKTTKKKKK